MPTPTDHERIIRLLDEYRERGREIERLRAQLDRARRHSATVLRCSMPTQDEEQSIQQRLDELMTRIEQGPRSGSGPIAEVLLDLVEREVQLQAEVQRLRARVAELEAARKP